MKICSAFFSPVSMHRGCSGHLSFRQVSQQTAGNVKNATGLVSQVLWQWIKEEQLGSLKSYNLNLFA